MVNEICCKGQIPVNEHNGQRHYLIKKMHIAYIKKVFHEVLMYSYEGYSCDFP